MKAFFPVLLVSFLLFGCSTETGQAKSGSDEAMRGNRVVHLLHLRNASQKTAKYEIWTADKRTELSHYSYHQPGQLNNMWVEEGNLLHITWQEEGPTGGEVHVFPQHPHKQWWWKIVDNGAGRVTLNADYESVPPGYDGN